MRVHSRTRLDTRCCSGTYVHHCRCVALAVFHLCRVRDGGCAECPNAFIPLLQRYIQHGKSVTPVHPVGVERWHGGTVTRFQDLLYDLIAHAIMKHATLTVSHTHASFRRNHNCSACRASAPSTSFHSITTAYQPPGPSRSSRRPSSRTNWSRMLQHCKSRDYGCNQVPWMQPRPL